MSTKTPHQHQETTNLTHRLSRIEGQIRSIKQMVADDKPCPEVLVQLAAVQGGVDQVARILLTDHIESCILTITDQRLQRKEWFTLKDSLRRFLR